MTVYLVTDLNKKTKEWHVVKNYEALLEILEAKNGQTPIKVEIKKITDDISHFLKNQKSYDRTYGVENDLPKVDHKKRIDVEQFTALAVKIKQSFDEES